MSTKKTNGRKPMRRADLDLLSALFETSGALIVVLDREGRITRFNRACEEATHYTFDEVSGKLLWDVFLVPEEIEPVKQVFQNLCSGELRNQYENIWLTRDGEKRLIAWSNNIVTGTNGKPQWVIAVGIDITERKKTEESLRESVKELADIRFALDESAIVAITDQRGIINFVNDKFCEISKYSREELLGQ
ncbi:MAG TPA: PAS domain S-box protein, partial [Blastocatellia bacterium]